MSTSNAIQTVSKVAAADLSSSRYMHMKLDTNGKVTKCDSTADVPFGILQNKPVTDEAASIMPILGGGTTKVYLSTTLASAALVCTDANGYAAAAGSGKYTSGQLEVGGAVGELGEMRCGNMIVAA